MGTCTSRTNTEDADATTTTTKRNIMKHPTLTTAPSSSRRLLHHQNDNSNKNVVVPSEAVLATTTTTNNNNNNNIPIQLERTSFLYDGLVRTHNDITTTTTFSSSTTTTDPNTTTITTEPPKLLHQYYDIVECIGHGSFSNVYKIRKKTNKIGGSSRPMNIRKSSSIGNSLHSMNSSTNSLSNLDDTNTTNNNTRIDDIVSPLLPKNPIQRQRSLRHIMNDNEGNLFPLSSDDNNTTTTTTTTTSNNNTVAIPELLFVLKEMDLSTMTTTPSSNNTNKNEQKALVQQYQLFMNEIQILTTLDHPHIIKIYETFATTSPTNQQKLQVVMEYCRGGDLYTRIPYLHESIIQSIVQQMISAIRYLHERSILHRDIKLENFVFEQTSLYDDEQQRHQQQHKHHHYPIIKLIDFGVSCVLPNNTNTRLTERIGTLYTMSPETILQNYSLPSDIWSLGVCIYMLLSGYGHPPFDAPTNKLMIQNILAGRYTMTTTKTTSTTTTKTSKSNPDKNNEEDENNENDEDDIWKQRSEASQDLIRHLLVVDPSVRYTIQQAQQHPWVQPQQPEVHKNHHPSATNTNNTTTSTNNNTSSTTTTKIHPSTTGTSITNRLTLDVVTKRKVQEAIIRYAFSTGDFMKLALNVLAKQAIATDIDDLRSIFDIINIDRTGTISYEQFHTLFQPNNDDNDADKTTTTTTTADENQYSDAYIEKLFHKLDVNKNNVITYTEFIAAVLEMHGKIEEYRFAEAFDQLDCDDSGYISKENIRELLGDAVDEAYIDKLIAEADYLNDGQISYGEFKQAFRDQMRFLVSSIRSRSSLSEILLSDSELSERMSPRTRTSK